MFQVKLETQLKNELLVIILVSMLHWEHTHLNKYPIITQLAYRVKFWLLEKIKTG
jgi:hypothetical protein